MYIEKLRKVVFIPLLDYNYCRNFFVKTSVEHPVFQSMFKLQNQAKENVKKFIEGLNNQNQPPVQSSSENLLKVLVEQKKQIERQIDTIIHKISDTTKSDDE